jgi:hypothetical protein
MTAKIIAVETPNMKLIAELDDEIARLMHTLPNATEHGGLPDAGK